MNELGGCRTKVVSHRVLTVTLVFTALLLSEGSPACAGLVTLAGRRGRALEVEGLLIARAGAEFGPLNLTRLREALATHLRPETIDILLPTGARRRADAIVGAQALTTHSDPNVAQAALDVMTQARAVVDARAQEAERHRHAALPSPTYRVGFIGVGR